MALTLRKALPEDLTACTAVLEGSEILERYYAGEGVLARMLAKAEAEGQLYVAGDEAGSISGLLKLVPGGFCGLYPYIALLAVGGAYRGQGVGRFLLAQAEAMGTADGARKLALLVSDFNAAAKAMYQRCGFYEVGLIPEAARPGIGEYLMLKDL
ncbi:GNAT family N-acetyltransferase [Ruminococcaceae bacterium OttesenSCG-928-D13]|nr:GNAT family N-acetyltransferase [Ruminococcaceae bacterium OttesenSCG-928-D13]